ncbi:Phosphopentomutase [Candidatus Rhodobacter oscarellae]|uniref:Phosphopentomutase n=1 Tax=Candidatus Rhodobacter oscarellae TaxID=1675527 RepID=A0A0J9EDD7_9RHOB|nr:phosphopentomutase [Candidatus Rhodobacter lobularis]KMW60681.1 Phosphopentomutase [Candidatus Rhodobacter lobularis]
MPRAFLIVLDSVGCGGAPDAADFGDAGANTLGHIIEECAAGRAEQGRSGPLHTPNMDALGLRHAIALANGGAAPAGPIPGSWGAATEISRGKDTPSGHWELAGVPVPWDWCYFPGEPSFPDAVVSEVTRIAETEGILGNCQASGTEIIARLGAQHVETGWPICYTSADSVFQIAAHEQAFGLERLLDLCARLAPMLHAMKVGRVIARPFIGTAEGGFTRTANRKDFAIAPPSPTLCDWVQGAGRKVHAVGKVGDIFSMQGIDTVQKGPDHILFEHLCGAAAQAVDGSLTFANFVEFDSLYGHRRDVSGYARHLEWFDAALPRFLAALRPGDLAVFTADHGNDPTWHGTDHTRERVPVLVHGAGAGEIAHVAFADVATSVADHLRVPAQGPGRSFL